MKRFATRRSNKNRRGLSGVEYALILGLISVAVVIGAVLLGGPTATRTQDTADGVGDPAQLKQFFDDMSGG